MLQEVAVIDGPKPLNYFELPISALGGDKRTKEGEEPATAVAFRVVVENSEGQAPFNILQASYEDGQGVAKMQMLQKQRPNRWLGLFTQTTFNAIMMLDFWNPVYSWRRGVLMQYLPRQTTLVSSGDGDKDVYDLEARFIQNVTDSSYVRGGVADSPEYQFVELLKADLAAHQAAISSYFRAVVAYLTGKNTRAQAIVDYLRLAESRRRIYRPLPLDEFGSSMPYALGIPYDNGWLEMRPDGRIQPIPARGIDFLREWTTSLAGFDPQIIPTNTVAAAAAASRSSDLGLSGPVPIAALPRPSLLALPCQSSLRATTTAGVLAARGCPYAAKRNVRRRTATVTTVVRACPVAAKPRAADTAPANAAPAAAAAPPQQEPPNWTDDILPLVTRPYWISEAKRAQKGADWVKAMRDYGSWDLSAPDDVAQRALSIYQHLRAKSMPITRDPDDYWPEEALETFRAWANAGFPRDSSSPPVPAPKMIIPQPVDPPLTYRIRRDIMSLSREELAEYQAKLDDVLQVGQLGSKWQELGLLRE